MLLGCSIPAKTFMPEFKGDDNPTDAFSDLLYKCRYACSLGYDYVELSVGAVNDLTHEQLSELKNAADNGDFTLFCCNSFVPPEIKICTEDFAVISNFVCSTMERLAFIGVTEVVFGSGYARKKPEEISGIIADERIKRFLLLCSDEGEKYGITTCIEPLNSTETNMINTTAEGARLVKELGRSNIKLLPDLFHMCIENENPQVLTALEDITAHLHASEAPGRVFPGKFGGEYLKKAARVYKTGTPLPVTVECVFGDFESEAKLSLDFMRKHYN